MTKLLKSFTVIIVLILFISLIVIFIPDEFYREKIVAEDTLEYRLSTLSSLEREKYDEFILKDNITIGILDTTIAYYNSFGDFESSDDHLIIGFSKVLEREVKVIRGNLETIKQADILIMNEGDNISGYYIGDTLLTADFNIYSKFNHIDMNNVGYFEGTIIVNDYSKLFLDKYYHFNEEQLLVVDDKDLFDTFIQSNDAIMIAPDDNFYLKYHEGIYSNTQNRIIYKREFLSSSKNVFSAEDSTTVDMFTKMFSGKSKNKYREYIKNHIVMDFLDLVFEGNETYDNFINSSPVIDITYYISSFPYTYTDRDGEFDGIYKLIFDQLYESTGINYNVTNRPDEDAADIIRREHSEESGLVLNKWLFKDHPEDVIYSNKYMRNDMLIISHSDANINHFSELTSFGIAGYSGIPNVYQYCFHI
ncbi:hypothetical protein RJG79_11000 [Mycoplasmatota bacterium WC44]